MTKVKGYYFCRVVSKEGDFFFIASRQPIALLACLLWWNLLPYWREPCGKRLRVASGHHPSRNLGPQHNHPQESEGTELSWKWRILNGSQTLSCLPAVALWRLSRKTRNETLTQKLGSDEWVWSKGAGWGDLLHTSGELAVWTFTCKHCINQCVINFFMSSSISKIRMGKKISQIPKSSPSPYSCWLSESTQQTLVRMPFGLLTS